MAQQRSLRQQVTADADIEEARGRKSYSLELSGLEPSTYYVVHVRAVARTGTGDRAKSSPTRTWPLGALCSVSRQSQNTAVMRSY